MTHRIFVGLVNGQAIWQMAGFDLVPFSQGVNHLTDEQKALNDSYVDMVKQTLDMPYYYFSYTYDVTHTLQRLNGMPPEFQGMGLHERADSRFVWNDYVLRGFQRADLRRYALPIQLGCKNLVGLYKIRD